MGLKEIPLAKGRKHAKVLRKSFGWFERRSDKNHIVLTNPEHPGIILSMPDHKEVDRKLLLAELGKAGITTADYKRAFDA